MMCIIGICQLGRAQPDSTVRRRGSFSAEPEPLHKCGDWHKAKRRDAEAEAWQPSVLAEKESGMWSGM
jgi:hypothetical protein